MTKILITNETHEDDEKQGDFMFQVTNEDSSFNFDMFTKTRGVTDNNESGAEMRSYLQIKLFAIIEEMKITRKRVLHVEV